MRVPHTIGWGIALALATALISGFSVYLNGRFVKLFDDPTLLAAVRNGLVGLALVGIADRRRGSLRDPPPEWPRATGPARDRHHRWRHSVRPVLRGPRAQLVTGGGVIHKTLFLWVAVLAVPFLGERFGLLPIAALGLLLAGTVMLAPAGSIGSGPVRAHDPRGHLLLGGRSRHRPLAAARGVPCLARGGGPHDDRVADAVRDRRRHRRGWGSGRVRAEQWTAIAITGALLAGYVLTWYAALQRAPATTVTSVLVVGAVITTGLQVITAALPRPSRARRQRPARRRLRCGDRGGEAGPPRRQPRCGRRRGGPRRDPTPTPSGVGDRLEPVSGALLFARFAAPPNVAGATAAATITGRSSTICAPGSTAPTSSASAGRSRARGRTLRLIATSAGLRGPARSPRRRGVLARQRPARPRLAGGVRGRPRAPLPASDGPQGVAMAGRQAG